jgi:hypothetical protein
MIHALCALLSLHEVDRRVVVNTIGRCRMRFYSAFGNLEKTWKLEHSGEGSLWIGRIQRSSVAAPRRALQLCRLAIMTLCEASEHSFLKAGKLTRSKLLHTCSNGTVKFAKRVKSGQAAHLGSRVLAVEGRDRFG